MARETRLSNAREAAKHANAALFEGLPVLIPPDFDGSAGSVLQAAQAAVQAAESPSELQAALGALARLAEITALVDAELRLRRLEAGR